ncbi:hypothetical protein CHISP_1497 [Chitinispirillum alkaliphilum]|nr:hypothetical protein CHISP_1497 [Chitinispirillum alkaliphilum]
MHDSISEKHIIDVREKMRCKGLKSGEWSDTKHIFSPGERVAEFSVKVYVNV